MQNILVIFLVAACVAYMGYQVFRYFKPKPGKMCGGGCCDGTEKKPAAEAGGGKGVMMVSAEDLRRRVKARK